MANLPQNAISDLDLFIGYEGDQAVFTSGVFFTEGVGSVFDISTRPEKRCKGYGTALFFAALQRIQERGVKLSVLQASPDGLSLYERAGFDKLGTFQVWSNRNTLSQ
jgi:ribosomal protein S18 acetylase RimI-like enzyme